MIYYLLIMEYRCRHWRGYNVKHRSVLRFIVQKVPRDCPRCRDANT